jgi:chromate reductase
MKKLIYFGASSSSKSINQILARYAASKVSGVEKIELSIKDFDMPLYSSDLEDESGIPAKAQEFYDILKAADGCIVSFAEHNGSYTAAFKNVFDWVSRIETKAWQGLSMLVLSTSTGARGGASVHAAAMDRLPRFGAEIVASMCVPSFSKNFLDGSLKDEALEEELSKKCLELEASLK